MSFRSSALLCLALSLAPITALAQRCDAATLSDSVCDCGCGVADAACNGGIHFSVCSVSRCPAGEVPWEHAPSSCMSSACGDGWKDPAAGEACDDGNALAGGGCSADCHAVTAGYLCGESATGCRLAPVDAGSPTPDAGVADAGVADAGPPQPVIEPGPFHSPDAGADPVPAPTGGCSTVPTSCLALAAALGLRRRSRPR